MPSRHFHNQHYANSPPIAAARDYTIKPFFARGLWTISWKNAIFNFISPRIHVWVAISIVLKFSTKLSQQRPFRRPSNVACYLKKILLRRKYLIETHFRNKTVIITPVWGNWQARSTLAHACHSQGQAYYTKVKVCAYFGIVWLL